MCVIDAEYGDEWQIGVVVFKFMFICNNKELFFDTTLEHIELKNAMATTDNQKYTNLIVESESELEDNQEGF